MKEDRTEKQVVRITRYNQEKAVRVSQELFQPGKIVWRMSTLGYRLLFALAQTMEYRSNDLFPELGFDKQTLFTYLGLENNNDRYTRLADTLNELLEKPLKIAQMKRRGGFYWAGFAWITSYYLATDERFVTIRLNDDVKDFLLNLKRYASIQPKYYLRLPTDYQNWFYPYLKNAVKLGKWTVSIEDLKKSLELENTTSYDPKQDKNATEKFLRYVIGIQISQAAKEEQRQAKAAKRPARPIAWDYAKNENGVINGTIAGISANTDINVTACAIKTGRAYTHIQFFISKKRTAKSLAERIAETVKNNQTTDKDFTGKKDVSNRRPNQTTTMKDLFDQTFTGEVAINPAYITEKPKTRFYYSNEQINEMARISKVSFEHIVKQTRLSKDEEGRYYKDQ